MRITAFNGMMPGIDPADLPQGHAVKAVNCYIGKGDALQPERQSGFIPAQTFDVNGNKFTGVPRTLWKSGDVWVAWDHWVHVVPDVRQWGSPHAFLFVDDGVIYRSSDKWIMAKIAPKVCGLPRPIVYPTVVPGTTVVNWSVPDDPLNPGTTSDCPATCEGGAQPGEARSYVFTWVNSMAEEGPPSDPSTPIPVGPDETVIVSDPTEEPPPDVVSWRWYRVLPGEKEVTWRFVKETPTGSMVDDVDPLRLGEELETLDHYPAHNIDGITLMGAASVVVWDKTGNVWSSVPKLPHAFPPIGKRTLPYRIVTGRSSVRRFEDPSANMYPAASYTAFILTEQRPFSIVEMPSDDGIYTSIHEHAVDEPCLAPWAATTGEGCCFYSSNRGILRIAESSISAITDEAMTRQAWTGIQPSTYALAYNQGRIFMLRHDGGYVVVSSAYKDDRIPSLSETTVCGTALWTDSQGGLFIADKDSSLKQWGAGSGYERAEWWSRTWTNPEYWSPGAIQIDTPFHATWDAGADEAWRLFKDCLDNKGITAIPEFWKCNPCLLKYRPYIDFILDPPTVDIYREGKYYCRVRVPTQRPVRLPRLGKGLYWSLRVTTRYRIVRIMIERAIQDMSSPTQPQEIL